MSSERIHKLFLNRVRVARQSLAIPAIDESATPSSKPPLDLKALKPDGMSWHDYLILLLQVGAELEHALMVQYLYAAYSLGGPDVPAEHRAKVRSWQDSILTIAREEMGHLLTVENLLVLIGGPLNFGRQDYPWDSPFYPFPFELEPLTLSSLSCYLYAEMPESVPSTRPEYKRFNDHDFAQITAYVKARLKPGEQAHHVDEIYHAIMELVADETRIPDSVFNADSFERQLAWDDFAKGLGPQFPTEPADEDEDPPKKAKPPSAWPARVIVRQAASRTMALDALADVAGQGEAPHLGDATDEPSHFDRFLEIYQGLADLGPVTVTRALVHNPTTVEARGTGNFLSNDDARAWANLANLRFRLLLLYLVHIFHLPQGASSNRPSPRAGILHRIFGEMFNLKAISAILVRTSAMTESGPPYAGPPFEVPYALHLPEGETARWRAHRDAHRASIAMADDLLRRGQPEDGVRYLTTLRDLDHQSLTWLEAMMATGGASPRVHA